MLNTDTLPRILPFAFYILVMIASDALSGMGFDVLWLYAMRVGGSAVLLWYFWGQYQELHTVPKIASVYFIVSVFIGLLVFYFWINLDQTWMLQGDPQSYIRIAGAALVVPVMEELFWRSFIMRWIDQVRFLKYPPAAVSLRAFFISSFVFALEHSFWFAGFAAGVLYAALYCRTQNLWFAITAHAVTNATLGIWVVYSQQWQYW